MVFSLFHVFKLSLSFSTLPLSLLLNVLSQSKSTDPWADWVARGDKRRRWSLTPRCFQFVGREIAFFLFWEHGNLLSRHGAALVLLPFTALEELSSLAFVFTLYPSAVVYIFLLSSFPLTFFCEGYRNRSLSQNPVCDIYIFLSNQEVF